MSRDGIVNDLNEATYHSGPELSVSGAKTLLKAPALYRWQQDHPVHKDVFDFGTVAHKVVLGVGPAVSVIPATSRAKADQVAHKEAKEQARKEGRIPITADDMDTIEQMSEALQRNDEAVELLSDGTAEVSGFWQDQSTGIGRRCRFDWLPNKRPDSRLVLVDYKTAKCSDPDQWARDAANYGYEMQMAWYIDAAIALGIDPDPTFAFIVQEKTAPYLTTVIRLNDDAVKVGRYRNRKALQLFAECTRSGKWPGYRNALDLPLPGYHLIEHAEAFNS